MPELYNLKTKKGIDGWIITKFDGELNVLSNYRVSKDECECPRGDHPSCRHRKMIREFTANHHVDDGWLFDFHAHVWLPPPFLPEYEIVEIGVPVFYGPPPTSLPDDIDPLDEFEPTPTPIALRISTGGYEPEPSPSGDGATVPAAGGARESPPPPPPPAIPILKIRKVEI